MARADLAGEAAYDGAGGGIAPAEVRPSRAPWRGRRLPRVVLRVALGAWMGAGAVAGIALLGRWIAPPPAAAASALLPRARSASAQPPAVAAAASSPASRTAAPWFTLHVLYASCRCSESIFAHLFQRGPIAGTRERIVLVAERSDDRTAAGYRVRAATAGFAVETVTPAELARRFGVEAAPLLVVADPTGRIRYAGGYADGQRRTKAPLGLGDQPSAEAGGEAIVASLMSGRDSTDPPLLPGAVGRRLQAALDPSTSQDRRTDP